MLTLPPHPFDQIERRVQQNDSTRCCARRAILARGARTRAHGIVLQAAGSHLRVPQNSFNEVTPARPNHPRRM